MSSPPIAHELLDCAPFEPSLGPSFEGGSEALRDCDDRRSHTSQNVGAWRPVGIEGLEPDAWAVVRSDTHHLAVAGPGAGKTELLAQRALYLLATGLAPAPRRVLAISFKRDAASVLGERVRERLREGGRDRLGTAAARFDSLTFDAFARGLVARFRAGVPPALRPPAEYETATGAQYATLKTAVRSAVRQLRASTPAAQLPLRHANVEQRDDFVADVISGVAFRTAVASASGGGSPTGPPDALTWATAPAWAALLRARPCVLTFEMIRRMAQLLLITNPRIAAALRATYSHVFLDEFQDVTQLQYELLQACFPPSGATDGAQGSPHASVRRGAAVLTAVGDGKQSIMGWAGAMPDVFARFEADYGAARRTLLMNYRSDRELVRIQGRLIAALDPNCPPPVAAAAHHAGTGRCEVLAFDDDATEAEYVADSIADLIAGEVAPYGAVAPRDVCLLARQLPDRYTQRVQEALRRRGVTSRLEDPFDELLRDEAVTAVLRVLRVATGVGDQRDYTATRDLLLGAAGVEEESPRGRTLDERLGRAVAALRARAAATPTVTAGGAQALVRGVLNDVFRGSPELRRALAYARNDSDYQRTMREFARRLQESAARTAGWGAALADFVGTSAVPVMSVHKSKGLQFHTVVLVGLEDGAWTRFGDLSDEDTRLFFVAFSRAKQQVMITYAGRRRFGGAGGGTPQTRARVDAIYRLLKEAGVRITDVVSVPAEVKAAREPAREAVKGL